MEEGRAIVDILKVYSTDQKSVAEAPEAAGAALSAFFFEPAGTGTGANCYDNGVNHSFWVPALNGKKDIVPGRKSFLKLEADKPGTYLGQCAEYCGMSHANMRLRVIADTRTEVVVTGVRSLTQNPA